MVGVRNTKQAERARHAQGGVEGRGGLALAPGALEAGGAGAAHLPQPGDEGAGPTVQAIALDRAGHALIQQSGRFWCSSRRRRRGWRCRCCC